MGDPLAWLDDEADERRRLGLDRKLTPFGPAIPGRIATGENQLINFGSNDYLGLASDPRVIDAATGAAWRFGWGAGASPLVSGWRAAHEELAEAVARFENTEAAVVFPSGFAANCGTIAALVGPGDAVYADRLSHACLIAGAKLSGASLRVFPHNDADRLEATLRREQGRYRRCLIVTEGVFSMDGDLAPLAALVAIAERFGAMLLVDEAHATGVIGPDGRGACSSSGVADRVPIRVGTLSKALGSIGGFVAGSNRLIAHLVNRASTLLFSTALPPAAASAALVALRIAEAEPWRRERACSLADRLRRELSAAYAISESTGPIVPLIVGQPVEALRLAGALSQLGLFVPAIRAPTVPRGTDRLRITVTAAHTDEDIARLIAALLPCKGRFARIGSNPVSRDGT
jgi:8-amino-7-oxononanoate synthase